MRTPLRHEIYVRVCPMIMVNMMSMCSPPITLTSVIIEN